MEQLHCHSNVRCLQSVLHSSKMHQGSVQPSFRQHVQAYDCFCKQRKQECIFLKLLKADLGDDGRHGTVNIDKFSPIPYPLQFDPVMLTNDICLIKLSGSVPLPIYASAEDALHQYIILNSDPANEHPGDLENISGWGITSGTGYCTIPHRALAYVRKSHVDILADSATYVRWLKPVHVPCREGRFYEQVPPDHHRANS